MKPEAHQRRAFNRDPSSSLISMTSPRQVKGIKGMGKTLVSSSVIPGEDPESNPFLTGMKGIKAGNRPFDALRPSTKLGTYGLLPSTGSGQAQNSRSAAPSTWNLEFGTWNLRSESSALWRSNEKLLDA